MICPVCNNKMRRNFVYNELTCYSFYYCRKCQLQFKSRFGVPVKKYTRKKYHKRGCYFYYIQNKYFLYDPETNKSSMTCPLDKSQCWFFKGLLSMIDLYYLHCKIKKLSAFL